MKKQIYFLATAALATGLAACSNDELEGDYSQNLASDQLVAYVEQAVSTRVNVEGKSLTWVMGDSIGVFSDNGDENQMYSILTEADAAISKFSNNDYSDEQKKNKKPVVTNPKFAYYPYFSQADEDADAVEVNRKEEVKISVPASIVYNPDNDVLMPMVGNITGSHIAFQNTAAILRVNVVGLPASTASVSLTSNVKGMNLSGPAKLNFKNASLTMGTAEGTSNANMKVTVSAGSGEETFDVATNPNYTFYFVVPVGNYSKDGGKSYVDDDSEGLIFQIGTDGATFTADLNAQKNHLYEATLYYDSSTSTFVKDDIITTLNDDLGNIEDGGEATADWTVKDAKFAAGTIYVPSVPAGQTPLDKVTINLKGVGESTAALTIQAAPGGTVTPKEVVINVNTVKETATAENRSTDPTYGALTITLPNSAVTLNKLGDKDVTLTTVISSTAANVFKIKKGITISTLTVSAGNVYLEEGAKVTSSPSSVYFFDAAREESDGVAESAPYYAPLSIYNLLFPTGTKTVSLPTKGFTVTSQNIEVGAGVNLTLDLNGQDLKLGEGAAAASVIKVSGTGAKLTIVDNPADDKQKGSISSAEAKPIIIVEDGGEVTVSKGTISNTNSGSGQAITVEKNGKFILNGGTISSTTAIELKNGSSAELNSDAEIDATNTKYAVAGNIIINKAGTTANAQTDKASTLELKKGAVNGSVTINGGTFTLTNGTVGAVTVENGQFDLTAGTAGAVTVKGGATVNLNGGTVPSVTDASGATSATKINVNAGATINQTTASSDAITLANGATATVKGGNITATQSAVKLTKGTLTVTGTGEPVLTGATTIYAVPTAAGDVTITLDAAKAKYVSTSKLVLSNTKIEAKNISGTTVTWLSEGEANAANMKIKAGYFTGDVITDLAQYFITGGYFQSCAILSKYGEERNWFQTKFGLGAGNADSEFAPVVGKE